MDYSKLSTATLKKLRSGEQIDYGSLPTEDLVVLRQMAKSAPKGEDVSKLESLGRGALQGASFGFADEITGAVESAFTDKTYEQARDESRAAYEKAREANPGSYLTGDVGASIATSFVPGLNVAKGASLAARVGKAAALGATAGLGYSDSENAGGMAADAALGGALGGGFQAIGEKVVEPVLKKVTDGKWVAKKFGKAFANVDEDVTEKYIANPGKYQDDAVKGIDVLKDEIDSNSRRIVGARESAKAGLSNVQAEYERSISDKVRELDDLYRTAKDAVGEKRSALNEVIRVKKEELDDTVRAAREALGGAKSEYGRASRELVNDLKGAKPPMEAVDKLTEAIELLSDQVSSGSAMSFDALDREGVEVSRKHLVKLINDARKSLQIGENIAPMTGSPARKHYDQLTKTILDIRNMPTSLEGRAVKRIIQDLDDTINYISTVGGRSGRADAANSTIRSGLNKALRNKSEAFASTMDNVARKTDLLAKLNKSFGSREQILARIMELPNDNAVFKREMLDQLAAETGVKVDDLIAEYMDSQRLLKDPSMLDAAKKSLFEFQDLQKAEQAFKQVDMPASKRMRFAQEAVQDAPEYAALREAEQSLDALPQTAYDRKVAAQKSVEMDTDILNRMSDAEREAQLAEELYRKNYVSEAGSEPLLKRMLGRRGTIEDQRLVERLGGTLKDDLDSLRVNQAFTRPDVAGSRRTLAGQAAGKLIGMGIGSAVGYEAGGEYGAGAGALAGFGMDRHAGKIFKAMLDGSMRADAAIQQIAPNLGRYAQPLLQAASRGNKAVATTHFILSQRDPEYRKTIEQMDMSEDK